MRARTDDRPKTTIEHTATEFADAFDEVAEVYDERNDDAAVARVQRMVVEQAAVTPGDTVVDLGTGTGAVALDLAPVADTVVGVDVSYGMLAQARQKAAARGLENVELVRGCFRGPGVRQADIVVTSLALHHLDDEGKQEAVETVAALDPRQVVFGETMHFEECEPEDPPYNSDAIDPATVRDMAAWLADTGFVLTAVERLEDQLGVLVACERMRENDRRSVR